MTTNSHLSPIIKVSFNFLIFFFPLIELFYWSCSLVSNKRVVFKKHVRLNYVFKRVSVWVVVFEIKILNSQKKSLSGELLTPSSKYFTAYIFYDKRTLFLIIKNHESFFQNFPQN